MKKSLWVLLIIIIAWAIFTMIKVPSLLNSLGIFSSQNKTTWAITTTNTGLVFVNDARFNKKPVGGLEGLREEPGGLAELEKCKLDPASFGWWIEKCDEIQARLDAYILADYSFEYSGFYVYVLDTSAVSWHEQMMTSGMLELTQTGTYPINLVKNILTNTIWMNRGFSSGVVDMPERQVPNADITKTFISFEGQDGMFPIIHIIFKKWNYLVRITNMNRAYPFGNPENRLSPTLIKIMKDFYDIEMTLVNKDSNHELKPEQLIEAYTTIVTTNTEYTTLMNQTITNALNRFAIQ